ncbi:hypothetical protein DH2020_042816 [Rehmannia glutinosa]|uniref:Uncharacterized protein n=1 Tax=Rehmannia glutinosa TaxID=99300 RepID=A0ABR0UMB3_REHGL
METTIYSPDKFAIASDVTVPNPSQRNKCCKCISELVCMCSSYIRNRDLPSIILRGKEPDLYRNGCTHRIRACERNLLDKELCISGETDKTNDENNIREQEESEETDKAPAYGAKTLTELEKKLKLSNFQSFPQKRKRATRVDVPSNIFESNSSHTTKGLHAQSVRERVFKYTFQRKRKRESLSGSKVNATLETEKKTGDKQNGDQNLEQSKSSLLKESSRDSRRLAQVARQVGE